MQASEISNFPIYSAEVRTELYVHLVVLRLQWLAAGTAFPLLSALQNKITLKGKMMLKLIATKIICENVGCIQLAQRRFQTRGLMVI